MRTFNGILCLILIFFAALQYNDPDPFYWAPVYLAAALWAGLAALRPATLMGRPWLRGGAFACLALFVAGFLSLANTIGAGWIHVEEARESLGYAICAVSTVSALWATRRRRPAAMSPA